MAGMSLARRFAGMIAIATPFVSLAKREQGE